MSIELLGYYTELAETTKITFGLPIQKRIWSYKATKSCGHYYQTPIVQTYKKPATT